MKKKDCQKINTVSVCQNNNPFCEDTDSSVHKKRTTEDIYRKHYGKELSDEEIRNEYQNPIHRLVDIAFPTYLKNKEKEDGNDEK